jgi:hypothetical protein
MSEKRLPRLSRTCPNLRQPAESQAISRVGTPADLKAGRRFGAIPTHH